MGMELVLGKIMAGGGGGLGSTEALDWSQLPLDPLLIVMAALEPLEFVRSGAACSSWRAAYATIRRLRIPTVEAGPCLIYPRAADDPDMATVYSPCSGASFRIRLPDPPLSRRSLHGAAHGWLVAADEASNLHLVNPLTGVQHALPPVTALHGVEASSDEQGNLIFRHSDVSDTKTAGEFRHYIYLKAVLSCSPCAGRACIVLLLHMDHGRLSFARLGDKSWTLIEGNEDEELWAIGYRDAVYNKKDGLFYVVGCNADIITLDLNGPSPVVKKILDDLITGQESKRYLVVTPWGDLLQALRLANSATPGYIDPGNVRGLCTTEVQLYRVDIDNQKLVRIMSLEDHALFLGLNSTMIVSTRDFPMLKTDCAYLAYDVGFDTWRSDSWQEIRIWNFISETLEDVNDIEPWKDWPLPIWMTPTLC